MLDNANLQIGNREDAIAFLRELRDDLAAHPTTWENGTLERYLEALQAVLMDWPGRFANGGKPINEDLTWQLFGEALLAASIYE